MDKNGEQNKKNNENLSQTSDRKPSRLMALSTLMSLEGRIEATKKKLFVMQSRNQKQMFKTKQEKRTSMTRNTVEKDIQEYKKRRDNYKMTLEDEISEYKMRNEALKKQTKRNIEKAQKSCKKRKNIVYLQTKKQEKLNEKLININKNKEEEERKKMKEKVLQDEIKARKLIDSYNEKKISQYKLTREEQTKKILNNISSRQKVLSQLERYGSSEKMEESKVSDLRKTEDLGGTKFRVKIINKGTTTVIQ